MTLPQTQNQQQPQSQHFLLKWNNHRSNMVNVFESLLQSENLVDVTIAVEGKFLKAHKIILSACSPYFQAMFVNHSPTERYPIIIFHDMKFAHLKTLLDFMYRGEISIDEKDLGEVLKVAEALSIRGLSSFESDDEDSSEKSEPCQSTSQNQQQQQNNNTSEVNNASSSESTNNNNASNSSSGNNASSSSSSHQQSKKSGAGNKDSYSNKTNGNNSSASNSKTKSYSNDNQHNHNHSSGSARNCDSASSVHHSNNITAIAQQLDKAVVESKIFEKKQPRLTSEERKRSLSPPAKKKRGRHPKVKNVETSTLITSPHIVTVKTPSSSKLQSRFAQSDLKSTVVPRTGVRRRLPRRFPGVPTRLKRVKLSKQDANSNASEDDSVYGSGGRGEEANSTADLQDPGDCEPLSEMSVRGLDLFKYASVEDGVYRCIECEKLRIPKTFKNKYSFQRHAFLYHEGNMRKVFPCPVCSREFSRPDKMKNHMKSVHEGGGGNGRGGSNGGSSDLSGNTDNVIVTKVEGSDSCDV